MKTPKITTWQFYIMLGVLALLFFVVQKVFIILFLTFIFSYLAHSSIKALRKYGVFKNLNHKLFTTILFLFFISLLVLLGIIIIPTAYRDTVSLFQSIPASFNVVDFVKNDIIAHLPLLNKIDNETITEFLVAQDLTKINLSDATEKITVLFGTTLSIFIDILVSFILSFFIVLEQKELSTFFINMEKGPIGRYYLWLKPYVAVLADSFGKTFESQALIALINSLLTIIGLSLLGMNYLLALWFIVFIFSFVPVFGVIFSSVPILIIGFFAGGFWLDFEILILIIIIHFIEAYFLNPKIYASRAKLPITIAFIALVVGEFVGHVWGLLLAIPTMYFLYDIFVMKKVEWNVEEVKSLKLKV